MDCQNLQYVKLPDTLLTVGNASFECCYALEKVDFGYGVQTIEFEAFSNCKMLREITLPVSLKTIVKTAFAKIPFRSVDFMNFLGWQLETERYLKKPKIKKINKKLLMNKEKAAEFLIKHYDVKWVNTADLTKMKKF